MSAISTELNFNEYFENLDKWRETHEDNIAIRAENSALYSLLSQLSERAQIALSELKKDPYNIENIDQMIVLFGMMAEGIAKQNDNKKISQICYPHLQKQKAQGAGVNGF